MTEDVSRGMLDSYYKRNPSEKLDRVKELLTEKFNYLKGSTKNHERQIVYVAATLVSGIAGYALTGKPEAGLGSAIISASISIADYSTRSFNKRVANKNQDS